MTENEKRLQDKVGDCFVTYYERNKAASKKEVTDYCIEKCTDVVQQITPQVITELCDKIFLVLKTAGFLKPIGEDRYRILDQQEMYEAAKLGKKIAEEARNDHVGK